VRGRVEPVTRGGEVKVIDRIPVSYKVRHHLVIRKTNELDRTVLKRPPQRLPVRGCGRGEDGLAGVDEVGLLARI
jgi:hypothetical protein